MIPALLLAIITPIIYALMNVYDKTIITHRVKNILSYASLAGLTNIIIGLSIALMLDWTNITYSQITFPAIAGIILGLQFYIYYHILAKDDVSQTIGIIHTYPILVAALSYVFLNEVLTLLGYFGMILILLGVVLLSHRAKQMQNKLSVWLIASMIVNIALYEFTVKISTNNIPALQGIALNSIFIGLTLIPLFFQKRIRTMIKEEMKNIKHIVFSEFLTASSVTTTYFAMAALPATIVSSLAATQPVFVLLFERIFHRFGAKIIKDTNLMARLIPLSIIVAGVIILTISQFI